MVCERHDECIERDWWIVLVGVDPVTRKALGHPLDHPFYRAFNRKAADELAERLHQETGYPVLVDPLHVCTCDECQAEVA